MAVVEAAEQFADHIVDEGMTAQLERDMTAIAEGEATFEEVTEESREMLRELFDQLEGSREAIGEHLREALKADRTLGPCPESGHDLLIRRSRHGSYFVGCDGFPDCRYTLPLPGNGEPTATEEVCEEHGLRQVKILAGRGTYVHGCPLCKADEADETADRVIGACPDCGDTEGGELAIKQLRNGSRLVGCTRYPDCEYSLPLPRRGDVVVTEQLCEEHDLPALEIHDGEDDGDPWELGCPICNYREFQARQRPDDLEDLDGVGEATAERLGEAGVESLEDLAAADPEEVAGRVQGVSVDRLREWQEQARA
jgi:DNA topoisomerase-1